MFSIASNEKSAFVNYFKVMNGSHYPDPKPGADQEAGRDRRRNPGPAHHAAAPGIRERGERNSHQRARR
ncbi:MAG: hypothetical protein WKG07_21200 [Hymenobacter sp.]